MEWTMAKASKPITLREWQAILDSYLKWTRGRGKTDEEVERMEDWFAKETNEAFRAPVRSFDDLVVLAAVACHGTRPMALTILPIRNASSTAIRKRTSTRGRWPTWSRVSSTLPA